MEGRQRRSFTDDYKRQAEVLHAGQPAFTRRPKTCAQRRAIHCLCQRQRIAAFKTTSSTPSARRTHRGTTEGIFLTL